MSRLTSTTRPLRLFSESGKWRSIGSSQADRAEAQQVVAALFDDWATRWNIPWFDKRLSNISPYSNLDRSRLAAVAAITPDMTILYNQRQLARVEAVGTRHALAIMGHFTTIKQFPTVISVIRAAWLPDVEADPFNPNTQNGGRPPLEYFVPIRDSAAFDGPNTPHKVRVVAKGAPFEVNLKDDVFVLYSVGSDNAKNNAVNVQNTAEVVQGADYLIWPPVVSLVRQHMLDEGQIK